MKLLIAIPTVDYIHYAFAQSLTALVLRLKSRGVDVHVCFRGGTLVYLARNDLGKLAVSGGYTHVLWLDADMVFRPTLLEDLDRTGRSFVTGICHARRPPHKSCVFSSLDPAERITDYPAEPFRVAGCGMAACLMGTEILRTVSERTGEMFRPQKGFGEDLSFCRRATSLGLEIWADPAVQVGHIAQVAVYPDAAERCREGCGYEAIHEMEVCR